MAKHNFKKILILNLIPNTVGDTLLLSIPLRIIKKNIPSAYVAATVSPLNKELLENSPYLDKLIVLDELELLSKKVSKSVKFLTYLKLIKTASAKLKKYNFDLCFVLLPNFFLAPLISYFAQIPVSVGYSFKNSFFDFLLQKKMKFVDKRILDQHFVYSYLDLLKLVGFSWKKEDLVVSIKPDKKSISDARKILAKKKIKKFVCFQAGTKAGGWAPHNFSKVADFIVENLCLDVVLLGSPGEKELNNQVITGSKNKKRIHNLSGAVSLKQSGALLRLSKFSVCNDSGLSHLSSAVGTTTIDLFGATSPNHAVPLGPGKVHVVCKRIKCHPCFKRMTCKTYACMKAISVEDVTNVIQNKLKRKL